MSLRSHIAYFLRFHIFSFRILALDLFNLVFWILIIAGADIGAKRGSALIGLALGMTVGILFLGFCYATYVLTHRNEFIADPGAAPNGGPAQPSAKSAAREGPPSAI